MIYKPKVSDLQAEYDEYDASLLRNVNIVDPISTFRDPALLPRRAWLYGRHYLRGSVSASVADGGVGKSTFAIAEGIAMATGRPLLGVTVPSPLKVFYLNLEDSAIEIERRVYAVCQQYGIDPVKELTGRFFYQSGHDHPFVVASMERGGVVSAENLRAEFFGSEQDVVIIDPFVACHAVSENDNTAIDLVVKQWAKIAVLEDISIEIVHHVRKPATGGPTETGVADARGASALVNAARSVRVLNPMSEAEAQQAGVENRRMYFRSNDGKANYGPLEGAAWYQLTPVDLANGDNVTTVKAWKFPSAFDGVTTAHMTQVRSLAADGEYRADPQSPLWIGEAVAEVLGLDVTDHKKRIKSLLKAWLDTGVLKVEQRKDANRKVRLHVVPGDWTD
jgi:hypothetical protein